MKLPFFGSKNKKKSVQNSFSMERSNSQAVSRIKQCPQDSENSDKSERLNIYNNSTINKNRVIFAKQKVNTNQSNRTKNKLDLVLDKERNKIDKNFITKFKKSSAGKGASDRERSVNRKNFYRKLLILAIIILSPALLVAIIYFSTQAVLQIRNNDNNYLSITGQVYGFEDIPIYPGATFVFENYEDSAEVKEFISAGYSIYRLSPGTAWSDVETFYIDQLSQKGWQLVKDVPRSDSSMKYGKYFVKNMVGIRIYTEIDDIVFQRLSETDAREGLKRLVDTENARKQAIKQNSTISLLPDYPWRLDMPGSYVVTYTSSNVSTIQKAKITLIGDNVNFVEIIPFITYDGRLYDEYLYDYTSQNNISIINSEVYLFADLIGLKAQVKSDDDKNMVAYVINSPRDNVVFIFYGTADSNSIMEYVVQNIVPMNINH